MKKLVLIALLASAAIGTRAHAQVLSLINPTTLNGSFEATALGGANGNQSNKGFDTAGADVLNWNNTNLNSAGAAAGYTDSGVQMNTNSEDGVQFVFFHGGDGGAFNLTTYTIQAGDQFNLSWYGDNGGSQVLATLFSSNDGTFASQATLAQTTVAEPGNTYIQYALPTYTATAADVGKTIGVTFTGVTGYANVDNVVLTVTSAAVPEPSSYVMLALGGLGVIMAFRRQRA